MKVVIWLCMTPTPSRPWGVEEWGGAGEECGLERCVGDFPEQTSAHPETNHSDNFTNVRLGKPVSFLGLFTGVGVRGT